MAIDYEYMKRSVRRHKGNLTKAQNSGDPHRVLKAVHGAFEDWDQSGNAYPDDWHRWKRAGEDAEQKIRTQGLFTDRRHAGQRGIYG